MEMKESVGSKTPEDKVNRFEFRNLESQVKALQKTVTILTALCDNYAKRNGIKVETYRDGVVVISQI